MKSLLALLLLLAPACAQAYMTSTGTFVHLTSRRWHTFDPANAFDAVSHIVAGNVYEPLITFKSVSETDRFEPFLASQVPSRENGLLSEDHRTYTFPIRPGVLFHDGTPLTPEDVRYSLLRFMLLDSEGGPAALLLRPILGVSSTRDAGKRTVSYKDAAAAVSVKDQSVVITLKKPDSAFLKVLASLPIVCSKAWAAANKDWDGTEKGLKAFNGLAADKTYLHGHANGTGPFRLKAAIEDELLLARHDGYWRAPAALEQVRFRIVGNGGLRLFMLQTGDADSSFLEDSYRPYAKAVKTLRVAEALPDHELGDILFFGFRTASEGNELLGSGKLDGNGVPSDFFSDPDVRRGFALAFDYELFDKTALGGQGRRVLGPFPAGLTAAPLGEAVARDEERAREAFQKAYGGEVWAKGFVVPVAYSANNPSRQLAAEALRDGLAALNPLFKVHLYPLQSTDYYAQLEARRLPLFLAGYYADYPDPQSYAFGLLHSQSYFPRFQGFADPALDALLDKAAGEAEPATRAALYLQAADLGARDLPHVYTYAPAPLRVYGDWVLGTDSQDNVSNLNFNNFPYFYPLSKRLK